MKVQVRLTCNDSLTQICLDIDCTMSLINRSFFKSHVLETLIKILQKSINVREIDSFKHQCQKYVFIDLYLSDTVEDKLAMTHFTRDAHIVNNLKAKLLLSMNIMSSERIFIDIANRLIIVNSCQNLRIELSVTSRANDRIRRVIHFKNRIVIKSRALVQISIRSANLSNERDFCFELEYNDNTKELQQHDAIYAHIVDCNMSFVHVRNDSDNSLIISRHTRLRTVVEVEDESCYVVDSENHELTDVDR